jgi:hypothetical protein
MRNINNPKTAEDILSPARTLDLKSQKSIYVKLQEILNRGETIRKTGTKQEETKKKIKTDLQKYILQELKNVTLKSLVSLHYP